MNAGVHGHYGPGGTGSGTAPSRGSRGAEVPLKYGGDVVGKPKGNREAPDEDEAQLDPEILALIEKEVGGAQAVGGGWAGTREGERVVGVVIMAVVSVKTWKSDIPVQYIVL